MNTISKRMSGGCGTGTLVNSLHRFAKLRLSARKTFLMRNQTDERSSAVNISATQVLLAMASCLCLTGPLLWMFVRYWLFAP